MTKPQLKLLLAAPRGFCAGVDRAIKIVELALQKWGAPVYVRHEIVHNKFVVDSLRDQGAIFVQDPILSGNRARFKRCVRSTICLSSRKWVVL